MEHKLKTLPECFKAVAAGRKPFEVRRDDRDPAFTEGDTLLLEEWDGTRYTGRWVRADVGLVLRGEYCRDGYCIMAITPTVIAGVDITTQAARIRAMIDEELEHLEDQEQATHDGWPVVLPCYVGDTVYMVWQHKLILAWRVTHIQIQINGRANAPHIRYWAECINHEQDNLDFWDCDIDKTVFITHEKAKAALGGTR